MSTVVNLHTPTTHMDYSYSRHSNAAGAPLPRIPRRTSCARSGSLSASSSTVTSPAAPIQRIVSSESSYFGSPYAPTVLVVHPPTPPRLETSPTPNHDNPDPSSSSSSGSESYVQMNPRAKRVRTPNMQTVRPPAQSTPTPDVLMARSMAQGKKGVAFPVRRASAEDLSGNETPRASSSRPPRFDLRLDLDDLRIPLPAADSTSKLDATVARAEGSSLRTISAPHASSASIARKKSGEPLKSSLKARRPVVRGDLSVVTGNHTKVLTTSKSEPTTPKSVHFDKQLEHVKLFLAEQKPLAISREGSPTDTSGTESDFPSAIYGKKGDDDKVLTMQVTNMPSTPRIEADVAFEKLTLSADGGCLNGCVRVRNIAFQKWVAVRFTVDYWQTTSEVTAKYLDSVPGGLFDRFSFVIRLGDFLARIEEKTMFLAIRYNVDGREIWDNNEHQNYKVAFAKVPRPRAALPSSSSDASLASLKSKLESVVKGQETVGGFMAHGGRKSGPFTLQSSTSLSERYDFAASLKNPWRRSPSPASGTPTKPRMRNVTYPNTKPAAYMPKRGGKQVPSDDARLQALARGSPRIIDPEDADSPIGRPSSFFADDDDTPVPMMARRRNRNHQRGYFDLGLSQASPSVKRTPVTSPTSSSSPDSNTFSPTTFDQAMRKPAQARALWFLQAAGSEVSTPSVTSNSESSEASSPSSSPTDNATLFGFGGRTQGSDSYSVFLNKYCYYTGAAAAVDEEVIQRSHSASSVEEFLSMSPNLGYFMSSTETPTRSSSYDDVVSIGSGSTTPTSRSGGFVGLVDSVA